MTTPEPDKAEISREIQATLAARRDIGTEYDEHFAQRLTDVVMQQAQRELTKAPTAALNSGQRMALGIVSVSVVAGLPLTVGNLQFDQLLVVALTALGINIAANWRR